MVPFPTKAHGEIKSCIEEINNTYFHSTRPYINRKGTRVDAIGSLIIDSYR